MPLTRRTDWLERLTALLMERRKMPFAWGVNDCGLLAADCILAMTDVDLAAGSRGKYSSESGARAWVRGIERYVERVAEDRELPEIPLRAAKRGDLILWRQKSGPTLGIVSLDGLHVVSPGPSGLVQRRVLECSRAWRIG